MVWDVLGYGVGSALALGLVGRNGQHWAVRVLCGVAAGLALVVGIVAWLFAGQVSPVGNVLVSAVLAFAVVVAFTGMAALGRGVSRLFAVLHQKN